MRSKAGQVASAADSDPLSLEKLEALICRIIEKNLRLRLGDVHRDLRLVKDLNLDSLGFVEVVMAVEEAAHVSLPDDSDDPVYKAVFVRPDFTIADFAELVYVALNHKAVQPATGIPPSMPSIHRPELAAFTQLGGDTRTRRATGMENLGENEAGRPIFRRRSDGMICVHILGGDIEIGSDSQPDESPAHRVVLDSYLIDREPVSTTAYCRFLNSVETLDPEILREWFVLSPQDRRREHQLIVPLDSGWQPRAWAEHLPMMLVSWFGANAYSLWANGQDWRNYADDALPGYLPTEAQWEFAARGGASREFPWGDAAPSEDLMQFGRHHRGAEYAISTLPLSPVNARLGLSPFGLHHMAGNIWQWCRDWYAPDFYRSADSLRRNACNCTPTGVRSERGGSWIGPAFLCRSSYRRGRAPLARGRCLGFRCVGKAPQ